MAMAIIKLADAVYTLSHPENDRDVTEHVQQYTLQDASLMRQTHISVSFWTCEKTHTSCAHDDKRLPPEYALTSQSFSRWDKV